MGIEKLEKWQKLLLDVGKRNNLISFKDSKTSTVEVLLPDFLDLFNKITHSRSFEVYEEKEKNNHRKSDKLDATTNQQNNNETINSEEQKVVLSKAKYFDLYKNKINPSKQLLLYNGHMEPSLALKRISKKAKTAIEETGVNICFLAIGFIDWTENDNSEYHMKAPILLVPIAIENESAIEPIYIKVIDDDIAVNPTFSYKLENDYGIKLPEIDDDTDLTSYFNSIREITKKMNWAVTEECKIGLFSFLKINMYKDLKENSEKIINNVNILKLLGENNNDVISQGQNVDGVPPLKDLLDLHTIVDADSSQSEAIEMAREGKSFVLQGPPGTGKSQTISNIIAESLFDDKKVLFVSEKTAALNIVYDKLKQAGLDEFCLELHNHKSRKKEIIENLYSSLHENKKEVSDSIINEQEKKKEYENELDSYAYELHKKRMPIGKSLYEIYEEIANNRIVPNVYYLIPNIQCKGNSYIVTANECLNNYIDYTKTIGQDYRKNCWYGYCQTDSSFSLQQNIKESLQKLTQFYVDLIELQKLFSNNYHTSINSLFDVKSINEILVLILGSTYLTPKLADKSVLSSNIECITKMKNLSIEILRSKSIIETLFFEEIFEIDGIAVSKQLETKFKGHMSRFFSKYYHDIKKEFTSYKKIKKHLSYLDLYNYCRCLESYQIKMFKFNDLLNDASKSINNLNGIETNFDSLLEELNYLNKLLHKNINIDNILSTMKSQYNNDKITLKSFADKVTSILKTYEEPFEFISKRFDNFIFDFENSNMYDCIIKCKECYSAIDKLDNWCSFYLLLEKLKELELIDYVIKTIEVETPTKYIKWTFDKIFYNQWASLIIQNTPILKELSRIPHDQSVKNFNVKDKNSFEINKAIIRGHLFEKRPTLEAIASGSDVFVLSREAQKKRKQKSIRRLLFEIGGLIQDIKPCFLMSPLSVSTFLGSNINFDLVVFDEASQIFPQDAIGTIYRGKQIVIVGDSKQMPPSNFFNASIESGDTDEVEDNDLGDFESILDICAASLPQLSLKWHYRSKFEQLIAFSNKNFYNNELITFPSTETKGDDIGIKYYHVNGIFDRNSNTNRIEAEKVVDLIFRNIQLYPNRTLGVVAFSISQQDLIENLLYERIKSNQSYEKFFKSDKKEPFFIKNLETVQGDERDTIIFSVAYGKGQDNRLLLNFGPINKQGGERRLNVAVTRAKINVQLVTSLHFYDIDLARAFSNGARLLREYLDFAENGVSALNRTIIVNQNDDFGSDFEEEVCEFLRDNGYCVDTQVGCSSFKIDLAIKKPSTSNYILAIECDGASYHSSKNARDRDRLRQQILENMGWKFYRIWSTDWFRNTSIEKENLLEAVKESYSNDGEIVQQETKTNYECFEKDILEKKFAFPEYVHCSIDAFRKEKYTGDFIIFKRIVEIEGPISMNNLKRIISDIYNESMISYSFKELIETNLSLCYANQMKNSCGFLFYEGQERNMLRVPKNGEKPRNIGDIAQFELANGIREILKLNGRSYKDGIIQYIVKSLGFKRTGNDIKEQMDRAILSLGEEIDCDGNYISLSKKQETKKF